MHPMTPCPEQLKPAFAEIKRLILQSMSAEDYKQTPYHLYICLQLSGTNTLAGEVVEFIDTAIETQPTLGSWLRLTNQTYFILTEDPSNFNKTVETCNQCRLSWLDYLIGDRNGTP